MPISIRIEYENAFYHVMNSGCQRQKIFHDDNHYLFTETLLKQQSRWLSIWLISDH